MTLELHDRQEDKINRAIPYKHPGSEPANGPDQQQQDNPSYEDYCQVTPRQPRKKEDRPTANYVLSNRRKVTKV